MPNTRKPSHWWVYGEFWNLRGQHNRHGKHTHTHTHTHTPTDYAPKSNFQQISSPDTYQQVGAEQGVWAALLRVRTGPEFPEDNLRELT